MRVNRIAAPVTTLGPGRRVALWVQGCSLGCLGCASRDTWSPEDGAELSVDALVERLRTELDAHDADGLTVSGGEPFQQAAALADVLGRLTACGATANRDVLIFTGYAAPRARSLAPALWDRADALVCGPYRSDRPSTAWLRASSNQVLVTRTSLGRARYDVVPEESSGGPSPALQLSMSESSLTMAGLPRPGDLERFQELMAQRGIEFKEVSWET